MTLPVRARGLSAFLLVTVALVGGGCRRAVRPEAGGDRTVETGVPVGFGAEAPDAPVVTWDFGDGSPHERGAHVSHAFARQGSYAVRALDGEAAQAQAQLTVVPRSALRAIPDDAEVAVFFPQLRGNVDPMMGFLSHLMGEGQVLRSLEAMPLLGLVLRDSQGEGKVVDADEGMGFFSLPDFDGIVVFLGVTDPQAAEAAVLEELRARGATVVQREPQGGVRLRRDTGLSMLLFEDRGYLYLVVPDAPETPAPAGGVQKTLAAAPGDGADLAPIRGHIVSSAAALSESPLLAALRPKVAAGNLHVFAHPEAQSGSASVQGAWAALRFQEDAAELEGWLRTDTSFVGAGAAPASRLLDQAPRGPIAALTVSMPPQTLTQLVFGAPGSEQRAKMTRGLAEQGLDAASVEGLLGALRGDLALLAYLDAASFYRNLVKGSQKPEPRGSLLLQAGLVRAEPVVEWLTGALKSRQQPFQVVQEGTTTRLTTRVFSQPVEFAVQPDRVTMRGGEPLEGRAQAPVGAALRERFGAGGFESGHLSAMLDVGRARDEMDAPGPVADVAPQQLAMVRAIAATFLEQLPPVDSVFLDFSPEPDGGRFRMSTRLRSR
jgi:hypothetical protein